MPSPSSAGTPPPTATFDRALFDNLYRRSSLAVFLIDVDEARPVETRFTIAELNPVHERLTGLDADALRGRTPRGLVPVIPEDVAAAIEARYQRCVEAQASITYEERIPLEGRETWWMTTLTPVLDSGTVVRLIGTAHEITSRKQAELELEAQRREQARFTRRLRQLHRISTTRYASFDALFESYLRAGTEMFDLPLGIVSRIEGETYTVRAACSPDDALARGDTFDLDDTLCAFVIRGGTTVRYHAIGEEPALQSHPVYTNMRLEAYISTPIRVGERVYGTLNFSGTEQRLRAFTDQEVELIELMADGIAHALELDAAATALERAKEEAERAREAAEAANRAKSTFLSTMSHEIRTPLNGVLGFAELLRMGDGLPPTQRRYAEVISQSGQRLMGLINDVLDLARVEAGRITLQAEPAELDALLAEHLEVHAAAAAAKGLELSYDIAPATPNRIRTDGRRLGQVIGNLVSNAVKFTTHGSVRVHVAAEASNVPPSEGDASASEPVTLRFTVEDTGAGIDAEHLARVFEPFYQVDASTTRQHAGSGLGLAICRELVDAMGGRLHAESEVGAGTRFTFTVLVGRLARRRQVIAPPAAGEPAGAPAREAPGAAPPSKAARYPGLRVIVAEDDAVNRELARGMLAEFGVVPAFAENGRVLLERLAAERYDVVLLDVTMPEMDGLEAAERIHREYGSERPYLIALTARAMREDREAIAAAGVDAYVAKPFSSRDLRRALDEAAGRA